MKYFAFILVLVFLGCNHSSKQENKNAHEITIGPLLLNIKTPSNNASHLPRLKASGNILHMTWVEQNDSLAILKYANYNGKSWSTPQTITSGNKWFVNWADFPALAVNGAYRLTNILEKSNVGTYDYDIKLQLTKNDVVLKDDILLNTDGVDAEHGFVSMQAYDGGFYISWLDGRYTKNDDPLQNQMTLRNAYVDLEGNITQDTELDTRVCDCCNTATAITGNGPIVAYRDRSDSSPEIRDMAIVRWVDGEWTTPKTLGNDNWELNGCPVNGPAMDTQETNVVVSWFTAQGNDPRMQVAFSTDNGANFKDPIRLDNGNAIGRVAAQFLDDGSALVSWLEPKNDNIVLQIARVYPSGKHDAPITVTTTTADRQSGFPQLEVRGNTVYAAFTRINGDAKVVEMISFEL